MNQTLLKLHEQLALLFPGQHVAINISVGNYITKSANVRYTLCVSPPDGDFKTVANQCSSPDILIAVATNYVRNLNRANQPKNNPAISAAS